MLCSASLSSIRVVDTLRVVKSHKVANRCFRAGALRKRFVHAVCASFVHCTSFCMLVTRYDPYSKLRNLLPAIFLGVGHACQHSHNSAAGSARLPSFAIRATMSPNKGITLYTAGTPNGYVPRFSVSAVTLLAQLLAAPGWTILVTVMTTSTYYETSFRWKASIICEELGIDYKVHPITLSKNEQKEDWFLKINPNGRIPAIGNALRHMSRVMSKHTACS